MELARRVVAGYSHVKMQVCASGGEGLSQIKECAPELPLLDMGLPDMNGRTVLAQLRAQNATANLPIAVLSADAIAAQIELAKSAGADDYTTKPLDIAKFQQMLESYISLRE